MVLMAQKKIRGQVKVAVDEEAKSAISSFAEQSGMSETQLLSRLIRTWYGRDDAWRRWMVGTMSSEELAALIDRGLSQPLESSTVVRHVSRIGKKSDARSS
jgi:hypothetical protein